MTQRPLRPYQVEAADAIEAQWENHPSTLLVLPTGMGKTRVISEVLRRRHAAGAGPALVLAHRKELLDQAARAIGEDAGLACDVEQAERQASLTGTLYDSLNVVVGSVQTLKGKRLERWPAGAFKTVVIDEAHHAPAASYRKILEHFAGAKVLGVTATPDRGDEVGLWNVFESCAYRYEIRRAIREGWLCPISVKAIECADLDISDVKTVRGDLSPEALERALTIDKVLHQIAGPLVREAGARPTIVFTAGVAQAHALAGVLGAYTDAGIQVIDGTTDDVIRADVLAGYQAGRVQFLINCAVLTEGFDAPHTACVAMARPTKSRALYQQCIGRGTRLAPDRGKSDLLVLDFVGNSGRHALVTVIDVLAGDQIRSDVRKKAEELIEDGMSAEEALTKAQLMIAESDARRERELERRRREEEARKAANVQADVAYIARQVDPFAALGLQPVDFGPPVSQQQLAFLKNAFKLKPEELPQTKWGASRLIDSLKGRQKKNLCTYRQAVTLSKYGLERDLSFSEAKEALDELAQNGWRVTDELRFRFGARPARKESEAAE